MLLELLQARADVDKARTDLGGTPMSIAAHHGKMACLQTLINANGGVNKVQHDGGSPLSLSAEYGNVGCMQMLLRAKAEVTRAKTE